MTNILIYTWVFTLILDPLFLMGFSQEFSLTVDVLFSAFMAFYICDKVNIYTYKTFYVTLFIYYSWVVLVYLFVDYIPIIVIFLFDILFAVFVLFEFTKSRELYSDEYNSKYVYLIFFKPKSFYQFISSLFGLGVASMGSIFIGKDNKPKVARLKHSKGTMQITPYNQKYIQDNYLLVNTGVECAIIENIEDRLKEQSAYSKKRFGTRTNCVESQKPLLDELGGKWKIQYKLDFLPAFYIFKRLKGKK